MTVWAILASLATGLMLGLFGSGGSIVTLPALIYLLGVDPKPAIAMSLGIVAITAAMGAITHWRRGNVDLGVAFVFGLFGVAGTYVGARLGVVTPVQVQLGLFALVMYLAAWRMLRPQQLAPAKIAAPAAAAATADGGIAVAKSRLSGRIGHVAGHGMVVGILTGLVGVGGGFLIVPALVLLSGLPMKLAVGTSLVVVSAKSVAGFVGYVGAVPVDWPLMGIFTAIAIGGSFIGTGLAHKVSAALLKKGFAVFLVLVATYIVLNELM